jgi:hypothetical protein
MQLNFATVINKGDTTFIRSSSRSPQQKTDN